MKSKHEKVEYLQNLPKEENIHEILSELLPEMGFEDVTITHERGNKPENGKDLVCSMFDKIENKKDWLAFVVKKGSISGTSQIINEVENQVVDCFKYEYKSILNKERIKISKVKIVTNSHFSNGAKDKILDNEYLQRANIDFWDGSKLLGYIEDYYPKFWIRGNKEYKKFIERFQERIRTDNVTKSLNINDKKIEKIIKCAIEPKLIERTESSDGTIKWTPKKANTIVEFPKNSVIIGEPGSGKSTLFKTLSNEIIIQNSLRSNDEFYPIILTFKEIEQNDFDLIETIKSFFQKDWNSDLGIDVDDVLLKNSCAIFIDALDELPEIKSKENALLEIGEFSENYPNIRIICSSRPSDFLFHNCEVVGFRYLEIEPLNFYQIENFLNNYFNENLAKSKTLLKSLKDSEILDKMPKTPLTIALITILFDEKEVEIPATITDLYEYFVKLLIGKTEPSSTIEIIEIGAKHRLLCYIAKKLHTELRQSISESEFLSALNEYSKERGQEFNDHQILDSLVNNVGLLFINEKNEIQFKHLSFQEYFTAYEIFHHRQGERELFINGFNDLWWQNVAIFYAGMSKDAPKLLESIISKCKPSTLRELIVNTTGMGHLLQALYNTPINERILGLVQGLQNITTIISILLNTDEPQNKFFNQFSKYGLLQIFGYLFQHSNSSITLLEPIAKSFETLFKKIGDNLNDDERFDLEYQLFMLTSVLASENYLRFNELRKLVDKAILKDYSLFALYEMHIRLLRKSLPKEFRKDDDLNKISKKIQKRLQTIDKLADKVNVPIKKIKSIKSKEAPNT